MVYAHRFDRLSRYFKHNTLNNLGGCAMKQLSKESFQRLYGIAEMQQGFFTTKQAIAAGYADKTHY